jgi:hypothetical protein
MIRDYKDNKDQGNVKFFLGEEIEHTPAYMLPTLFVVGIADSKQILNLADLYDCEHIYFGANQSFALSELPYGTDKENQAWIEMVTNVLESNHYVTLDYDLKYHEWVLESGFAERSNFIAQISVKIPYIEQLGYNACVKFDDKDFNVSNPGVWVHRVHDLMDTKKFTPWHLYEQDIIIKDDSNEQTVSF